ncbi:4,5-dihydroxyphthalate decarboxylase [Rhizobium sp. AC27/96]|uniref:PhnD/SsuA/transferrin family substrate-binding protein n=1 Tax=Rhizobium sp. AC27/96 TaxID=1841653 RepID=UPI0008291104|nr:ABC transporter substrate-binding protein [Rhizobium sp. AC27/96]OCJ00569.1 4,5-dihydroxyphthalate decarboxylase [Rhizobium sp. AC27/96]
MSRLSLSLAMGNYDRTRALLDRRVLIDGIDPVFNVLSPEEMFFRSFRHEAFDISELSLSSYCVALARGDDRYLAVPVFLSRAFRHTSIYVRTDRNIDAPADLRGKRIGLAEYQLTANVWVRALLEDDYGVKPSEIRWVRGGMDTPGRPEKIKVELPGDIHIEAAPEGRSLNDLLLSGDIDGFIGPRAPRCYQERHPKIRRLFADTIDTASSYFRRTGIFPIMHILGVRREIADRYPFVPGALFKAFEAARKFALAELEDTSATKVTMPFVEDHLETVKNLMGPDYWSYGVPNNRKTLDAFLSTHFRQGLSSRLLTAEELFHPSTLEAFSL